MFRLTAPSLRPSSNCSVASLRQGVAPAVTVYANQVLVLEFR